MIGELGGSVQVARRPAARARLGGLRRFRVLLRPRCWTGRGAIAWSCAKLSPRNYEETSVLLANCAGSEEPARPELIALSGAVRLEFSLLAEGHMANGNLALLPIGELFHVRYRVVRCIKAGGMGAVYEVIHEQTRRRCALKVMLPRLVRDPSLRARFQLEATVASEIDSEHIVEVIDAGVDPLTETPFIVMELLRGEELAELVEKRGRLPRDEVVALLFQAALALSKTHAAGIIHRDLKPENMFVSIRDDGTRRLRVLDFGIAKVVAESAVGSEQTGSMGTPLYMSPEQINGKGAITLRADLYALGHIAFALLTGCAYWQDESRQSDAVFALFVKIMGGAVEPACARAARRGVTLPETFGAWFARATAFRPEDRFDGAMAQVAALATALDVPLAAPGRAALEAHGSSMQISADAEPLTATTAPMDAVTLPLSRVAPPTVAETITTVPVSTSAPTLRRQPPAKRRAAVVMAATAVGAAAVGIALWAAHVGRADRDQGSGAAGTAAASAVAEAPTAIDSSPVMNPPPIVSASAPTPSDGVKLSSGKVTSAAGSSTQIIASRPPAIPKVGTVPPKQDPKHDPRKQF